MCCVRRRQAARETRATDDVFEHVWQHAGDTGGRCDGGNLGQPHHFVRTFTVDTPPVLETNADKAYMCIWLFDHATVLYCLSLGRGCFDSYSSTVTAAFHVG